ncbi:MAG: chemotaxis response regulator protein-glutamate methylesterase [Bacteroidetes bacterium]|nr:chemotaxis response regulator protein-glutamate methylesterase [Bacteroidota bacterium]
MISKPKIKILIVDDSALIRQTLQKVFEHMSDMEVIGTAADPFIAVQKMKSDKPDVITLDIQMPRMDGLTFLKKIMSQHPIPVVVISSISQKNSKVALTAFNYGAIAVIEKPVLSSDLLHEEWKEKLINAIRTAAHSVVTKQVLNTIKKSQIIKENNKPAIKKNRICNSFVLIGSSAGGTEVINTIVSQLDKNTAPLLIVQHMPVLFTAAYAERLNNNSELEIKEASSGDELHRGIALVSPGDKHMELMNNGFNFFVSLNSKEKVNRHRPSVDVLFNSALSFSGNNILAIILSGMGNDGSASMLNLKNAGAITVAQSKETCIVYGMPKEAVRIGAASHSFSIEKIVQVINNFSRKH